MSRRKQGNAEDREPRFLWLGEDEDDYALAHTLMRMNKEERRAYASARCSLDAPVVFVDAHKTLEVNDEINEEMANFVVDVLDRGYRVVVLSWVGFSPLSKVAGDIADMVAAHATLAPHADQLPIVTCTGNRCAKMLMCELFRSAGVPWCVLIDDSWRNMEASFGRDNLSLARKEWGYKPGFDGTEYWMYVNKVRHGREKASGALSVREQSKRLGDAISQWRDVKHRGVRRAFFHSTRIIADTEAVLESWDEHTARRAERGNRHTNRGNRKLARLGSLERAFDPADGGVLSESSSGSSSVSSSSSS